MQIRTISTEKENIMCKRILSIFFAVAGVAIIGLGAVNEAGAGGSSINVNDNCQNILFELTGVEDNGNGSFNFNYVLKNGLVDVSNLSYLSVGIDRHFDVFDKEGDPIPLGAGNSDDWLKGVPLKTLTITPQSTSSATPFTITVSGAEAVKGEVFAYTKAGRKIEGCVIEGPVLPCTPPDLPYDVTVPSTKQVALNDNQGNITDYCIDIDQRTGCPVDEVVYICGTVPKTKVITDSSGTQISPLPLDESFKIGGNEGAEYPTMIMGEGSDPRCPVAKAAHNPCQWVILSGRPYGPVCW